LNEMEQYQSNTKYFIDEKKKFQLDLANLYSLYDCTPDINERAFIKMQIVQARRRVTVIDKRFMEMHLAYVNRTVDSREKDSRLIPPKLPDI